MPPVIMPEPTDGVAAFIDLDHDRAARRGYPEAIFCAGKTPEQLTVIATQVRALAFPSGSWLATDANTAPSDDRANTHHRARSIVDFMPFAVVDHMA